jgi:hypothetical protein
MPTEHNQTVQGIESPQDREFAAWASSLGVPPERVKQAVEAVGNSADAVREYLCHGH